MKKPLSRLLKKINNCQTNILSDKRLIFNFYVPNEYCPRYLINQPKKYFYA